jgi:sterol desaturase/sphingolipid hydroxylase (fatty acid hydroxylase superfamily)
MAHFWPIGWRFHRVHHSDLAMNITTAYRFQLLEVMASYVPMALLIGLFGIRPEYFFIYEAMFVADQLFQHSNWALSPKIDRILTYLIVTPNYHRIHHSQIVKETDSNFGSLLTIWDRLFGTYRYCSDTKKIDIGLIEYPEPLSIKDMFILPFKK